MILRSVSTRCVQGLLCCIVAATVFIGCSPQDQSVELDSRTPGVSDTEILLGSSLPLKGHAGYLGTQTIRGAMSYIRHVNETGGIYGRKIKVITYDDSYDPPMCLANSQKFIIEDDVFSLFCYVGTPTTVKILPLVEDAGIPLLGMFTGANALREPFNPNLINIRASYYQETEAMVRHLVQNLGIHKIGVFYQYDAYGFDGLIGTELALKSHGLEPIARASYIRGTLDVEEGLDRLHGSGAEAVVMIGTYDPCAKFVKLATDGGWFPIFYNLSFVGAKELARRLPNSGDKIVIMSQVVPPSDGPEAEKLLGAAMEYVRLLDQYYPEERPNFVGLEGYFNARILVEGLKRAGRNLTRKKFIRAIESIVDYELAPGVTVSFSASDHQGMEQVYFTRLENGRFVLINDWAKIKKDFDRLNPEPAP